MICKIGENKFELVKKYYLYPDSSRICLQFIASDYTIIATATINMPEIPLLENEVLINDFDANKGMLKILKDNGVIDEEKPIFYYKGIYKAKLIKEIELIDDIWRKK